MAEKEYKKVIDYITAMIRDGELSVGDKLPTERALADKLNIGRNSIREAIRTLDNMGVIDSIHGSGNYITGNIGKVLPKMLEMMMILNQFDVAELHSFRHSMEKSVCQILLENNDNLMELSKKAMDILTKTPASFEDEVDIDMQFHFMLVKATGNRLMVSLMESVSQIYRDMIVEGLTEADSFTKRELNKAHMDIVIALSERNADRCLRAIDKHYNIIDKNMEHAY